MGLESIATSDSATSTCLPAVSIIIPVYRAAECLPELHRRLVAALERITSSLEIIMVEDDAEARCWSTILYLAARDPRVKGLRFTRNFGQHYGITAGLDHATGDYIIVMDCDLQDPPEAIPGMLAKANEGHKVVFATRPQRRQSFAERATSWMFYRSLAAVSRVNLDPAITNFSVVSRDVADVIRGMREHLRFYGGMIVWAGFPWVPYECPHDKRFAGKSGYNFFSRFRLAMRIIFGYSNLPLVYSTFVGFGIAAVAFLASIWLVARYVFGGTPPHGWTSLIVAICLIGGYIIFQQGIVGIYLGDVYNEVRRRPLYIVEEVANIPEEQVLRNGRV